MKFIPKNREDLVIKKVIFNPDGLEVIGEASFVRDDRPVTDDFQVYKRAIPHQDLINLKDSLKDYLMKAYGIDKGYLTGMANCAPSKKEGIQEELLDAANSVEVTRVSFSGSDQLEGAVVSGKMESFNGSKVAMNTPRIVYSSDNLGFEQEVEQTCNAIRDEVWEYLFNDKRSDPTLFGQEEPEEAVLA